MHKFNVNKILVLILSIMFISSLAYADVHVRGYTKSDGTVVREHYRSDPDGDVSNNWSHIGNVNPYTGEIGTKTDSDKTTKHKDYSGGYMTSIDPPPSNNVDPLKKIKSTENKSGSDDADKFLNSLRNTSDIDLPKIDDIKMPALNYNSAENDTDDNNPPKDESTMSKKFEKSTPSKSPYYENDKGNKIPEKNNYFEEHSAYVLSFILVAFIFYKVGKHKRNK